MRYPNLKAFEKHLASAAPHHLCRCYLVLIADDQERQQAIQTLLRHLPDGSIQRMSGAEIKLIDLFDALQSPSLFGGEAVVILDECEKLAKGQVESIIDFLEKPIQAGFLLLGARGKTPLAKAAEKGGVVLDLSDEKPWDKEKRISENLFERAKSAAKRLSPDAAPLLLERIGPDASLLASEIDKLICYVGDRLTIERADVYRIAASSRAHTLWQMAEGIVWEGTSALDPNAFHGLVPALRSQLSLGMKIASLIEDQTPMGEWAAHLPKIWPKTLEKRKEQAAQKGVSFFKKGLDLLFKIELLSRTGSTQVGALLDLFRSSMSSYARR
jgi:DNA polymerase-3 subunit delta